MARGVTSRKTFRRGTVSVVLTVLVVISVILINSIVTSLAMRYGWFVNMNPSMLYPVTDDCFDYLDTYVVPEARKSGDRIRIIFCDDEDEIRASGTQEFILNTAEELKAHYPDLVEIEFLNVWEKPSEARAYGVKASTSVVVKRGDEHRVCNLNDFFVFSARDNQKPLAYNGEKRFAVAMKAVVSPDTPMAYFTLNHGESFPDYALMTAATDAGYLVNSLDALSFDIPEDCDLLVTYNPTRDFTAVDGVSGISEMDKLEKYLNQGGKYMVFASADTFAAGSFANLEGFLADWGVKFEHRKGAGGVEECFAIRDTAHALSPDGYTILGALPTGGTAGEILKNVNGSVRVANATGISIVDGFTANGSGDFVSGNRTVTPLLRSHVGAEAWAGGRPVDRTTEGYNLLTLTQDSETRGGVLVCSSIEFANEASMQAGVYDNQPLLFAALGAMGKDDTPIHLHAQPFSDDTIRTMTTAQARTITIALTAVPMAAALICGLIVLIRRKFA